MANLIIQDTFDPYYSGRDTREKEAEVPQTGRKAAPAHQPRRGGGREIALPLTAVPEAPARAAEPWRKRALNTH